MEFTEKVETGDEKLDFSLQATADLDFCLKMERDYQMIWSDCLHNMSCKISS